MKNPLPPRWVTKALHEGLVIPAHPLALTKDRKLDERRQRALTRYYHAAGAGGVAVGVHTTQFEIREPQHGLFEPVLRLARETVNACDAATGHETVCIGGICGQTAQAVREAKLLGQLGYHAGLLSLGAMRNATEKEMVAHCRAVAREIPLMGFYLQPAVGGRVLPLSFWRQFVEIPNVIAVKLAPFNRYQTWDVVRAIAEAGRAGEIALYTGNDDNIAVDLMTEYHVKVGRKSARLHFAGGLLGHWACWTHKAVELLALCKKAHIEGALPSSMLTLAAAVTDANAAFFDAANQFAGSIAGIHEVLRRQGLLENIQCLNPRETLSPGQREEIDRVLRSYPDLNDDAFVKENLDSWLRD